MGPDVRPHAAPQWAKSTFFRHPKPPSTPTSQRHHRHHHHPLSGLVMTTAHTSTPPPPRTRPLTRGGGDARAGSSKRTKIIIIIIIIDRFNNFHCARCPFLYKHSSRDRIVYVQYNILFIFGGVIYFFSSFV